MYISDNSETKLPESMKPRVSQLVRQHLHKRHYEYALYIKAKSYDIETTKEKAFVTCKAPYQYKGVIIQIHNHPNGVCYPSLCDRFHAQNVRELHPNIIFGVYGTNQRKRRMELYLY